MPNVDLLCLITGADIDGSVCASERRNAPSRRMEERERERGNGQGERVGLVPVACSQSHPFLRCGPGRRRRETEALGHCRTKWPAILSSWSGDLRGADRKGLVGAARVTREINYTLLEVLTSDRTPEANCAVRAHLRVSSVPRRGLLLFSDDENRLRFFYRFPSAPSSMRRRRRPLRTPEVFFKGIFTCSFLSSSGSFPVKFENGTQFRSKIR